jgi:hypothetical protein
MANGRRGRKDTDRRDAGRFFSIPVPVVESHAYRALGSSARALMLDIASQYVGENNGRLLAGWKFMSEERGWRGKHTLIEAKRELLESGALVVETRIGKFPKTSAWFACTWWPLDWDPEMEMSRTAFPRAAYRKTDPLKKNAPLGAKTAQEGPAIGANSAQGSPAVGANSAPMERPIGKPSSAKTAQHLEEPSPLAFERGVGLCVPAADGACFVGRHLPENSGAPIAKQIRTAASKVATC